MTSRPVTALGVALFGVDLLLTLGHQLADPSAKVRAAAIAALAPAAKWNWYEAKLLLAKFARDPKNAVDDRLLAVQALADAAALIALAEKYDDNIIVPTLVWLLDDAQRPVRAAAFAVLTRFHAEAFGYDPAAVERAKPIAAWQQWATDVTGIYTYESPDKAK